MSQETPAQRKKTNTKTTVETKPVLPEISYTVSMSKPWTHLLEVEMRIKWEKMPDSVEIQMPVWTPGSYLVREYARHVESFTAKDLNGTPLAWQKRNKNTWGVSPLPGSKEFVVSYNVYANELTVRTNELNADHAFFTPAALLMFPKDQLKAASTLKVNPYKDWRIATGLPKVEGQTNIFRAENFDILYDSPFEVGNFHDIYFTVEGKQHRFVIEGEGNYDLNKIAQDTAKIVEESYKIFGELPYNDYTFILNLRGGGGLEHLNSTALQWNRFGFAGSQHNNFMTLIAHEYFHCFNVKRIRPDALGPFDYNNENYTKLLWVIMNRCWCSAPELFPPAIFSTVNQRRFKRFKSVPADLKVPLKKRVLTRGSNITDRMKMRSITKSHITTKASWSTFCLILRFAQVQKAQSL